MALEEHLFPRTPTCSSESTTNHFPYKGGIIWLFLISTLEISYLRSRYMLKVHFSATRKGWFNDDFLNSATSANVRTRKEYIITAHGSPLLSAYGIPPLSFHKSYPSPSLSPSGLAGGMYSLHLALQVRSYSSFFGMTYCNPKDTKNLLFPIFSGNAVIPDLVRIVFMLD